MASAASQPDTLGHYLSEIGKNQVLTREEERELFQRLEKGSEEARRRIIHCNLRFVVKIAAKYQRRGLPLQDLIQEGNIGLLEVIGKFDWRRGTRFSTYAAFWIRQAIQRALLRTGSFVRLPSRKARLLGKVKQAVENHRAEHHRDPSVEEMAEAVDVDPAALEPLLPWREGMLSLDTPFDEGGGHLLEIIAAGPESIPIYPYLESERTEQVGHALDRLSDREQSILRLRFGFDTEESLSLRKTSVHVGLSQEGVRRIERLALNKMRRTAHCEELACLA